MSEREPLRRRLSAGVAALSLQLADDTIERLLDYVDLLMRWNATYNLTAVRDATEVDSLAVLPHVCGARYADLGSGAGLPGIPLAVCHRFEDVLLVDSNGKKARFLREALRQLRLPQARVAESRVEAVAGEFDCITARAFATLADMLAWGGHLLAADGRWLALKGRFPHDELDAVPAGFEVEAVQRLEVPGLDAERHLVTIRRSGRDSTAGKQA